MYVLLQVAHSQLPSHRNSPQSQWCLLQSRWCLLQSRWCLLQSRWCLLQSKWCLLQLPPRITSQLNTYMYQVQMITSQYTSIEVLSGYRHTCTTHMYMYMCRCIDNVLTVCCTTGTPQPTASLVSTPSNSQPPTASSHQQLTEHTPGTDGHKGGGVSISLLG